MELLREYPKEVLMGYTEAFGAVYMYRPSWEFNNRWSFGGLGNADVYYHLNPINREEDLFTVLNAHFNPALAPAGSTKIGAVEEMKKADTLWRFCEIVETMYTLQKIMGIYQRGGSFISDNPCEQLLKNPEEVARINEVMLPKLIDEMYVAMGVVEPLSNYETDSRTSESVSVDDTLDQNKDKKTLAVMEHLRWLGLGVQRVLWNAYCSEDYYVHDDIEEAVDCASDPLDVARALYFGCVDEWDDYVFYDGYGNLQSWYPDEADIEYLADKIIDDGGAEFEYTVYVGDIGETFDADNENEAVAAFFDNHPDLPFEEGKYEVSVKCIDVKA